MNYRDSSGASHYGKPLIVGVDSSHGVKIEGGSTGGLVQSVGDDNNIALRLRAKGTGPIIIGDSSQAISFGGSAAGTFKGFFSSTNTWELAIVSSGQVGELTFSNTAFDINPGDLIGAIEVTPSTSVLIYGGYRTSSVATSRLTVIMANISSTATSTTSGGIRVTWADLT